MTHYAAAKINFINFFVSGLQQALNIGRTFSRRLIKTEWRRSEVKHYKVRNLTNKQLKSCIYSQSKMNFAGGLQSITQIVLSELLRQIKKPMRIQMRCGNIVRTFLFLLAIFQAGPVSAKLASIEIPCVEFSSAFNLPCLCSLNEVNATRINCDNVVFPGDFPVLPRQYYIQADMDTEFSGMKH